MLQVHWFTSHEHITCNSVKEVLSKFHSLLTIYKWTRLLGHAGNLLRLSSEKYSWSAKYWIVKEKFQLSSLFVRIAYSWSCLHEWPKWVLIETTRKIVPTPHFIDDVNNTTEVHNSSYWSGFLRYPTLVFSILCKLFNTLDHVT